MDTVEVFRKALKDSRRLSIQASTLVSRAAAKRASKKASKKKASVVMKETQDTKRIIHDAVVSLEDYEKSRSQSVSRMG